MSLKMMFKLQLFLLAVLYFTSGNCLFKNNSTECHKDILQELDNYLKEMELVHNTKRFPETMSELREACIINKKVITLMNKLANQCMTGFTKNIMQVTIYSIRKSRKSMCRNKPTKEIKEFLDAGKCVNGGKKVFQQCFHRAQANIMSLKQVESKKRIPFICCEMVRAKACLMDQARNVKQCTEKHLDTLQSRYTHVSGNSMNMACGEYNEETNKCDSILPPPNINYDKLPKSFMMSSLELIELFENDPELQIN